MYLSVAAAAIYMASQASEVKKTQKGKKLLSVCALVGMLWYRVVVVRR